MVTASPPRPPPPVPPAPPLSSEQLGNARMQIIPRRGSVWISHLTENPHLSGRASEVHATQERSGNDQLHLRYGNVKSDEIAKMSLRTDLNSLAMNLGVENRSLKDEVVALRKTLASTEDVSAFAISEMVSLRKNVNQETQILRHELTALQAQLQAGEHRSRLARSSEEQKADFRKGLGSCPTPMMELPVLGGCALMSTSDAGRPFCEPSREHVRTPSFGKEDDAFEQSMGSKISLGNSELEPSLQHRHEHGLQEQTNDIDVADLNHVCPKETDGSSFRQEQLRMLGAVNKTCSSHCSVPSVATKLGLDQHSSVHVDSQTEGNCSFTASSTASDDPIPTEARLIRTDSALSNSPPPCSNHEQKNQDNDMAKTPFYQLQHPQGEYALHPLEQTAPADIGTIDFESGNPQEAIELSSLQQQRDIMDAEAGPSCDIWAMEQRFITHFNSEKDGTAEIENLFVAPFENRKAPLQAHFVRCNSSSEVSDGSLEPDDDSIPDEHDGCSEGEIMSL